MLTDKLYHGELPTGVWPHSMHATEHQVDHAAVTEADGPAVPVVPDAAAAAV